MLVTTTTTTATTKTTTIINKIYFSGQITLHVAQNVKTEELQHCVL